MASRHEFKAIYQWALGRLVTQYWYLVLAFWFILAAVLSWVAPPWDKITADGDLAFLPPNTPNLVGQRELAAAFPALTSRSRLAIIFATDEEKLSGKELALSMETTRRLHWIAAMSSWSKLSAESDKDDSYLLDAVKDNLTQVIEIEEQLARFYAADSPEFVFSRLPKSYEIRGNLYKLLEDEDNAAEDLDMAQLICEEEVAELEFEVPTWADAIRDVWSWRSDIVGHKLISNDKQARLALIQLDTDFTATKNIEVLNGLETLVAGLKEEFPEAQTKIAVSGSAAFGADMLRASAGGVKLTEWVTVFLVISVLILIYRAPLLVFMPLTSIVLSLSVATNVIAILARTPELSDSWGLKVFTTTRIFIVVILFGVGTDFCLFFIARCRELLREKNIDNRKQMYRIVAGSWRSAHGALIASALTTIVGLGLMWFSQFEKFQFSGPIIAIALFVTLCVCLTFTPALLSGFGQVAFWPHKRNKSLKRSQSNENEQPGYWSKLANWVVVQPIASLLIGILILGVPAAYGIWHLKSVTYDLTEELSYDAPSRQGNRLIERHFPKIDSSPVSILIKRDKSFAGDEALKKATDELTRQLYVEGVQAVRSLSDPLGDYPPGKRMGLFDSEAWRRRMLQQHRLTRERYVSSESSIGSRVSKFDIQLEPSVFSLQAGEVLESVSGLLERITADKQSAWHKATFSMSGTAVGVRDLRRVTQQDQNTIQILVVLGVWTVLWLLLRQLTLSLYLIATVLLSYFATLGITYFVFNLAFDDYSGIDWKVPVFLFVILVAVGQDYNIYLVTRIFEEEKKLGLIQGVRRALSRTGGIITACGAVMACTFVAMTSPQVLAWLSHFLSLPLLAEGVPVLRGITELGFALSLGVLLDTLLVRTILVPSFVLWWKNRARNLQANP